MNKEKIAVNKTEKKNPHAGHREKLKRRFQREGLDHFEDHNILELVLFFAIPRKDTNEIAHALLSRFGSFSKVLEASIEELCQVDGIGENAAHLLKTYPAVAKRYYKDRFRPGKSLPEYEQMGQDLVYHFAGMKNEEVYALFFDNALCFCGEAVIHEGDLNSVGFSYRKLCDIAVRHDASYLVLAHNHPRGLPIASSDDLDSTERLKHFLLQINLVLIDHFIVGESRFSSIQKEKYQYFKDDFLKEIVASGGQEESFF